MEIKKPARYESSAYAHILQIQDPIQHIDLGDHLAGFDENGNNIFLDHLQLIADENIIVYSDQVIPDFVQQQYSKLEFKLKVFLPVWNSMIGYNIHPTLDYKNFVCSFNGSPHVSRKLLVSILYKFKWFNEQYCSKNFSFSEEIINGHIKDYVKNPMYQKFFQCPDNFFQSIYSFGHVQYNHNKNIYNLESKLTSSFLHIVSETIATSYVPFVTEKFLYSIVTRGLFLAYAQPGWHSHIEKYYGFKRYTKLFDYRFDSIQNPVERLLELMSMISKFSCLSFDDWRDLYLLQQDEIEYNYHHYFSQDYLKCLAKYS
jgi:hypothetical protein